eukprot:7739348-Prorocentrum_lima.AAC.1
MATAQAVSTQVIVVVSRGTRPLMLVVLLSTHYPHSPCLITHSLARIGPQCPPSQSSYLTPGTSPPAIQ